jgi:hypothetical protein
VAEGHYSDAIEIVHWHNFEVAQRKLQESKK